MCSSNSGGSSASCPLAVLLRSAFSARSACIRSHSSSCAFCFAAFTTASKLSWKAMSGCFMSGNAFASHLAAFANGS